LDHPGQYQHPPLFRQRWLAVHAYNIVPFNGLEGTQEKRKYIYIDRYILCSLKIKKSLESRKVIQAFFFDFPQCHQEKGMVAHVHILHEGLCSCPVSDGASANYYSRDYETTIC
jgi:hypothetical protein